MRRFWWFIFDSWRGIEFEPERWKIKVWYFSHPVEQAIFVDEAAAQAYRDERAMG